MVSKPGWRRFGYPLIYGTDALEILEILTRLGYKDESYELHLPTSGGRQNLRIFFILRP
jgi:hypothetical protein